MLFVSARLVLCNNVPQLMTQRTFTVREDLIKNKIGKRKVTEHLHNLIEEKISVLLHLFE